MPSATMPNYLPALTGLRAIAAYAVYFHHFPLSERLFGRVLHDFCKELYIGVSIFFVLSGFLITLRYRQQFQNGTKDFTRYFVNRFARIFPLYFILMVVTFVLPHWISLPPDDLSATALILNITLLKGYSSVYEHSAIAQGWTLTLEETFYLLAPVFFIYAQKIRYWMWIVIMFIIGILLTVVFSKMSMWGFFSSYFFTISSTFFGRAFEFFVGIYLALLYQSGRMPGVFKKKNGFFTAAGVTAITAVIFLMMIIAGIQQAEFAKNTWIGIWVINFLLPLAIGLFMYGLVTEKTWLRRLLETNFFGLLGKSSYAFYLIHMGVFQVLLTRYVNSIYLINFFILIAMAILLYKFLEHPLNKIIRKKGSLIFKAD